MSKGGRRQVTVLLVGLLIGSAAFAQEFEVGKDKDLMARYSSAMQVVVTQNWDRPDIMDAGLRCALNITQPRVAPWSA